MAVRGIPAWVPAQLSPDVQESLSEELLGTVDTAAGRFEPVAFCPGYLRALGFKTDEVRRVLSVGHAAMVG